MAANPNDYRVDSYGNVTTTSGQHVTQAQFQTAGLNVTQIPKTSTTYTGSSANTNVSQGVGGTATPTQTAGSSSQRQSTQTNIQQQPQQTQQPAWQTSTASGNKTDQFVQYAGSPDIFDKATGTHITEAQAQQAGIFGPNGTLVGVQTVSSPRPGITNESQFSQFGGQSLSSQEIQTLTGIPTAPAVPAQNQFTQYQSAISSASATLNAANSALKDFQLMDIAETKSIAVNPDLTKRLAARRISFINDPQSEYWLQRIDLQFEVDSARASKDSAVEDLNLAMKLAEFAKPDLIHSEVNSDGELISVYANPMNPSDTIVTKVAGFDKKAGKVVDTQTVKLSNGHTVLYTTIEDSSAPGGLRYEQKDLGATSTGGGTDTGFTDVQINKGAASAKTSIKTFKTLPVDIQNAYINDGEYMTYWDKTVVQDNANNKSKSDELVALKSDYEDGLMSKVVYDYYSNIINSTFTDKSEEEGGGFWNSVKSLLPFV